MFAEVSKTGLPDSQVKPITTVFSHKPHPVDDLNHRLGFHLLGHLGD